MDLLAVATMVVVGRSEMKDYDKDGDYVVRFRKSSATDYFGKITVEKQGGSNTMQMFGFNVTSDDSGNIPLGFQRPRHGDSPPQHIWEIAARKFASLEKGEDY